VIAYFGYFYENSISSQKFLASFSTIKLMYLFCPKNWLGYISGDFSQTHLVTLLKTHYTAETSTGHFIVD
jgi:hypothetical protein